MDALSTWLQDLGLERYTTIFADNDVDLEALRLLSDAELEKLGVSLGHRKKILKAIELNGSEEAASFAHPVRPCPLTRDRIGITRSSYDAGYGHRVRRISATPLR
jgi:hypothetical protein